MKDYKRCLIGLIIVFFSSIQFIYTQSFYNVIDYGAVNDGSKKCTKAIKDAISKASSNGGGTIFFPAGEYITGPIHLKSNITLYIDGGAVIRFSTFLPERSNRVTSSRSLLTNEQSSVKMIEP